MGSEVAELSLVLRNDLDELARISVSIDDFADGNDIPMKDRFEMQLCVEEIFTNIVSYGFTDGQQHEIEIHFRLDPGTGVLGISMVDAGIEFDPVHDSAKPSLDTNLQNRQVGGLGLHLVRQYVDGLEYERRDGRNHLTLTKKLSAGS